MSKKSDLDSFMKNFSGPVVNIDGITGGTAKAAPSAVA